MKRNLLLLVVMVTFAITSCGGGGGGESTPDGGSIVYNSDVHKADTDGVLLNSLAEVSPVASTLALGVSFMYPSPMGTYSITKTATGLVFNRSGGGSYINVLRNHSIRFVDGGSGGDDFYDAGQYITAFKEVNYTFEGKPRVLHSKVYLGGEKLNLGYTEFGNWVVAIDYEASDPSFTSDTLGTPFYAIVPGSSASFTAGGANQTFTGRTTASTVDYRYDREPTVLFGTATMDVDLSAAVTAVLTLDFDGYYNIRSDSFSIGGGNASFDRSGNIGTTITGSNSHGDQHSLTSNAAFYNLSGAIAGPSANDPTEIVGAYSIVDTTTNVFVNSAFGVKK